MTEQPKIYCSICKAETEKLGSPDDVGTQFYRCKNGHQTTKALTKEEKNIHDAFEIQAQHNGEKFVDPLNPINAFLNGKGIFKTALVAQWLHDNEHIKTDYVTNKMFYGDTKTRKWNKQGETKVQELVTKLLGQEDRESHYKNVLHTLKSLTFENIVLSKKLALENGNLDPETQEFSKPSLEEFIYYQLPVTYNPAVDPHKLDNWLEFLKQVTNPEDVPFLQEWSGYLLLPDYRFHFALWIHGEGRNGKGVYDRTMKGILGKNNVCARGIEELDGTHRFSLQHYYGKLYAVSSEPVTNKIFRTEIFQALTGSDTVQAEVKNGNGLLEFVNCGKLTVIGNQFPKIHNPTKAFKERMKFIEFPTFFNENERIPDLENVWLNDPEQKSAIFNWMLEGLKRLLSQGHFTQGKSQKETEILFQRTSDSLTAFITEMAISDKILTTTRKDAYEAYKNYCDVLGLYAVNEQLFTAKLKQTPHVTVTTVSHPSKLRAWKGIGFKFMDDDGKVSAVSEVSPLILSPIYQSHLKDGERVNGDTVDTSDTSKEQLEVVTEPSGVRHIEVNPEISVPSVPNKENDLSKYEPLTCYFCQKAITNNDWTSDNYTENKSAHKECYEQKRSELKTPEDREYTDDNPSIGEA